MGTSLSEHDLVHQEQRLQSELPTFQSGKNLNLSFYRPAAHKMVAENTSARKEVPSSDLRVVIQCLIRAGQAGYRESVYRWHI